MSTTITVSGGKGGEVLLTNGPYAEAKEVLGRYFLLEAADLDEVIAWAAQIPAGQAGEDRASPRSAGPRLGAC
ncbi:MAG TPA: YciI family protein [Streptosporangiaceae bacterium]|nr:YciI family protein [Streptosporangiaceae bacterium]